MRLKNTQLRVLLTPPQKRNIYVASVHIVDLKWADAIVHTLCPLPRHPHYGLFMAQCMAHKKQSSLHNYCLINWTIFHVVSAAADRLQTIYQFLRGCVSYLTTQANLLNSTANLCVSTFVCLSICKLA